MRFAIGVVAGMFIGGAALGYWLVRWFTDFWDHR